MSEETEITTKTHEKKWAAQRRRYRAYVASLSPEEFENERYTVAEEWTFASSDYARRYPELDRDDLLSLLGL